MALHAGVGWMLRWGLAGALLPAGAGAATVYLRSGSPAGVELADCSNSSPIVCTARTAHGLKAGDAVVIENAVGNTSSNGVRIVLAAVTATRFSLAGLDGASVAGNGAWQLGGNGDEAATLKMAGKALPYRLQEHPRVLLDGPQGKFTRRLRCAVANGCLTEISASSSQATATLAPGHGIEAGARIGVWNAAEPGLNGTYTVGSVSETSVTFPVAGARDGTYSNPDLTVSRYAWAGNPAWDVMISSAESLAPGYTAFNSNPSMEKFMAATLVWFTDRSRTQFLEMARHAALHVEDAIYGTTACDQSGGYCNGRSGTDYGRFNAVNASAIYSILVAENRLSTEERTVFADKMLNDVDTACIQPPIQTATGSMATVSGRTAVTGAGTRFLSEFAVGDSMWIPDYGPDDNVYRVKTLLSDTILELSLPAGPTFSGRIKHARKWSPGDCGIVNILKFHPHGTIGDPKLYPTGGGAQSSFYHNLTLTAVWSYVHIGLALADDDPRARRLLEGAWLYGYDYTIGYAMNSWTGFTQAGGVYHWYRSPWMAADLVFALKNAVIGYPDLLGVSPEWLSSVLKLTYYSFLPNADLAKDTGYGPLFGEGSLGVRGYWLSYQSRVARLFADTDENKAWHWWLKNRFGYTPANLADNQGQGALNYYLGVDPNLDGVDNGALPTQALLNKTGYEVCAPLSMRLCDTAGKKYALAVSRAGWTSTNDAQLQIYGGTFQPDHFENQAGDYRLVKGPAGRQPCLLGADAYSCATAYNGYGQNNLIEFGPGVDRQGGGAIGNDPIADITRWKTDEASNFVYAMVDLTGAFRASGSVQRARRHFAHFKKPGTQELVIVYDDVALGVPNTIRAHAHYSQNGQEEEGSTTCEGGCSTADIASGRIVSKSRANGLVTQFLPGDPGGRLRVFVEKLDGTYQGGNGYSFRVSYCASPDGATCGKSNNMEALLVHRLVEGASDSELTTVPLSPSPAWTGVQTGDKVVLFARRQLQPDLLRFKTTQAGSSQYLVAGLAPGFYDVFRGESKIAAGMRVLAADRAVYFESEAGEFTVKRADRAEGEEPEPELVAEAGATMPPAAGLGLATAWPAGSSACLVAQWLPASDLETWQADNVIMEWGPLPEQLPWSRSFECAGDCSLAIEAPGPMFFGRETFRSGEVPVHVGLVHPILVDRANCL